MSHKPHRRLTSILAALAVVGLIAANPAFAAVDPWQIETGYEKLTLAVGSATPVAAGVVVSQVEAPEGTQAEIDAGQGRYFPSASSTEFLATGDPLGQAVQFNDGSGRAANGMSNHATGVGHWFYGNFLGVAKGANAVTMYDADRWLVDVLKYGGNDTPVAQPFKVQNHSWIGNLAQPSQDESALRRYDYLIETGEVSAVVGANNNPAGSPGPPNPTFSHPNLLAHSFNSIVVGRTDSRHSRGMTGAVYGVGRFRPDIVSPAGSTSAATGQVSSAAALIRGVVAGTDADRSETAKAILLAGATKQEFASFVEPSSNVPNPWDRTHTRPLDDVFGAGELNVYNSYLMTVGGRTLGSTSSPAASAKPFGWDYQNRKADARVGDIYYNFVVPTGSTAQELSIVLAWNVKVTDMSPAGSVFLPTHSLQNLDLEFYNSSSSFLGALLDRSVSTADNVEHIYQTNLGPGTYTLKVSGAAGWDYGLAWRTSTLFDEIDADFDDDGIVSGADFMAWQRNVGKLVGATNSQGDGDGDGDVDRDDLAIFQAAFSGPSTPLAAGLIRAVPEPGTMATAIVGAGFATWAIRAARRRTRRGA